MFFMQLISFEKSFFAEPHHFHQYLIVAIQQAIDFADCPVTETPHRTVVFVFALNIAKTFVRTAVKLAFAAGTDPLRRKLVFQGALELLVFFFHNSIVKRG
jgi:hypothetical protein